MIDGGKKPSQGVDLSSTETLRPKTSEEPALPAAIKELFTELKAIEKRVVQFTQQYENLDGYILESPDQREFRDWVKSAYAERQARKQFFQNPHLFGEPCWDIILDLTRAGLEGKQISITSACIASGVPPTTALRWIAALEREGIIARSHDSHDKRRMFVHMTEHGLKLMQSYHAKIRSTAAGSKSNQA